MIVSDGRDTVSDTKAYLAVVGRSLAPSTWAAYRRVLNDFAAYVRSSGLRVESGDSLMAAAAAFLGAKITAGYAPAIGRQLQMAARLQWPEWADALRPLNRGLRGWERQRPVVKRPPLIRPLALAMAIRLAAWGQPAMGVAVVLAFHCYLRIGELLRMEVWHVVSARDPRTGHTNRHAFVHLPKTKTGAQQDVEIIDEDVEQLVALAVRAAVNTTQWASAPSRGCAGDPQRARVFPVSEHKFRRWFKLCTASLGISKDITPHSMRHGGATHDYTSQRLTTEQIRIRGRWRSEKSMHHYVGSMRSALANTRVPAETVWCGTVVSARLRAMFCSALARAPLTEEVSAFRRALSDVEVQAASCPTVGIPRAP
jgi:integrase